jgi:hypothetical protein
MHELIDTFLKEVWRYQGKNTNAVREDVQHLLTTCESQIRDAENDPRRALPAVQRFRKAVRYRVIEEIQQGAEIPSISHFQAVLSVIDTPASE